MKTRFRIAKSLLIPAALLLLLGASFLPSVSKSDNQAPVIDAKDYGHIRAYDGFFEITLAPQGDQRHRYEVGFGRVVFTSAAMFVSQDGRNFYPLPNSEPMGNCGLHIWGYGINSIIAAKKCVPGWAEVSYDPERHHAQEWMRLENLLPKPVVVRVQYQ